MTALPYRLVETPGARLGLIVLQSDETVEDEMRALLPGAARLMVSRVPSGLEVTQDSLSEMEGHLTGAATLFPRGYAFDAVGYACTSGSAVIGAEAVARLIRQGTDTAATTNPATALIAACRAAGVTRLGLVSPYVAEVSARLREVLQQSGIATPAFGSFDEASEAAVARIDAASVIDAARAVAAQAPVQALFLSCTNLRTVPLLGPLGDALGIPVWSSNLVLAWHLAREGGAIEQDAPPEDLLLAPRRQAAET